MAIDITCYTKLGVESLQPKLDVIKLNYGCLFEQSYLMYPAHEVLTHEQLKFIEDRVEKYKNETDLLIAEEFGLEEPKSYFMISVNDKSFPELNTSEIADMLRKELGEENIIVLLNGEDLI
ncbi:hypothetical protein H8I69_24665 [Serratia fonticola]|uniref:hypothetical protein n=1 Tax=Serratia fonticola TaxID=47917 RepID=UPI0015C584D7|nr:hypothetical protein [Serratia fonticola]MBC3382300.1 hypothetical protein [Serratia fonticola]NYA41499.1 hypothetical protein [Serratia fonticola]